ncbi:hypothetical protein AVEN_151488-1 [Araneus ventricosus]|uniref:Uncharacterized protein n=1 Tax=Araneus ventricosus TaxID=182803 RepID=A0A4Y2HYN9_ARAVE|nr:hypothetical protein AVEN_151488-1 [Araneus ventricosus]
MEAHLESVQASAREFIRPSRERMGTRCLSMADCRFGKGDLVSMHNPKGQRGPNSNLKQNWGRTSYCCQEAELCCLQSSKVAQRQAKVLWLERHILEVLTSYRGTRQVTHPGKCRPGRLQSQRQHPKQHGGTGAPGATSFQSDAVAFQWVGPRSQSEHMRVGLNPTSTTATTNKDLKTLTTDCRPSDSPAFYFNNTKIQNTIIQKQISGSSTVTNKIM